MRERKLLSSWAASFPSFVMIYMYLSIEPRLSAATSAVLHTPEVVLVAQNKELDQVSTALTNYLRTALHSLPRWGGATNTFEPYNEHYSMYFYELVVLVRDVSVWFGR